MFKTTVIAVIVAVLAAVGAYALWSRSRAASVALGLVCLVASAVAVLTAFIGAVAVAFKILPIILLILGIVIVWKAFSGRSSRQ
ncbi:hypothetical protein QDW14_08885 [Corynebacterium bovis]|uniref:hypothetical protein n=1 Tax=Corynebacterium bovis TaxID=36808 RepID=UPI00244C9F48|nr:hypothetical protein [Corynebacterium bovis]MDH2456584.1 hypothetical protein [Corynebacterium bovis]